MSRSNPSTKKSPTKEKPDKAQAILDGALTVFTTQGFAAASMDRIAKAAGVSKPTLYSYFQDKEGLFVALVRQLVDNNCPDMHQHNLPPDFTVEPAVMLRQIAASVLGNASGNPSFLSLMRLIIGESEKFPELSQSFVLELSKPTIEGLAMYFEMHPDLHFPDPIVTARMFIGSVIHYIIVQYIMQGEKVMPLDRDRMVDGLVELILAAGRQSAD